MIEIWSINVIQIRNEITLIRMPEFDKLLFYFSVSDKRLKMSLCMCSCAFNATHGYLEYVCEILCMCLYI